MLPVSGADDIGIVVLTAPPEPDGAAMLPTSRPAGVPTVTLLPPALGACMLPVSVGRFIEFGFEHAPSPTRAVSIKPVDNILMATSSETSLDAGTLPGVIAPR